MNRNAKTMWVAAAGAAVAVSLLAQGAPGPGGWTFRRVTNSQPQAGEPCEFKVELISPTGPSPDRVQVEMTCEQDPAFQIVADTIAAGQSGLAAELRYTFPSDARGVWKFTFQILVNGLRGESATQLVPMVSAPTPGPDSSPASSPAPSPAPPPAETRRPESPTPTPLQLDYARHAPKGRPDLVAAFVGGPQIILGAPGEKRALRYRIENLGDAPATNTLIRYGSNLAASADPLPALFEPEMRIAGVLDFELEAGMTEFWVEAVARGQVDANTGNNRCSRPIQLTGPSPYEVSISNLRILGDPPRIRLGDWLEAQFDIHNPGPAGIAQPFEAALEGLADEPQRQIVAAPFPARETRSLTFPGRVRKGDPGALVLTAIADSGDVLLERDKTNNFATLDLTDRLQSGPAAAGAVPPPPSPAPGAPSLPNLAIASAKADGLGGGQYRIEIAIQNRGTVRSPASALALEYVDSSLPLAERDVRMEADVPALEPGAEAVVARRISCDLSQPFAITATINPLPDAFEEATRADNSVQIPATPEAPAPASEPTPEPVEPPPSN